MEVHEHLVVESGPDLAGVVQLLLVVVVADQDGAQTNPGRVGSVQPPITSSWLAVHLSFSQSGDRPLR